MPTVWLQERLKLPHPPWWEIVISTVYMSFFILPYVVAGVLWLRNREEWKAFVRLFVGLSFAALIDLCAGARRPAVGGGPVHRRRRRGRSVRTRGACSVRPAVCPTAACSARCRSTQDGANTWIERIVGARLGQAQPPLGQRADRPGAGQRQPRRGDPVAARGHDGRGRGVPVAPGAPRLATAAGRLRPLVMAFTLVYTAEHYVIDILLGWAFAAVVHLRSTGIDIWRTRSVTRA